MTQPYDLTALRSARVGRTPDTDWVNARKDQPALVSKKDGQGNEHTWFGYIVKTEKLRNCQRLFLRTVAWWVNDKPYTKPFEEMQTFNNRSHPTIHYVDEDRIKKAPSASQKKADPREEIRRRRETRKAYAQSRTLLQEARDVMNEHLQLLGLGEDFTADQLKAKKRECMKQWHPDLKIQAVNRGVSAEHFEEMSTKYTQALSWADTNLQRRNSTKTVS